MQPQFEVADVLRKLGNKVEGLGLNTWQLRVLSAIRKCRTAELGGHIDACDSCGNISISYNSCRNRHCPKCQGKNREDWIQTRAHELLAVPYFHVVFTLPDAINSLVIHQPKVVYDILFEATWETLKTFGKDKGIQMGMIAVLHTWGQQLSLHPHLHCTEILEKVEKKPFLPKCPCCKTGNLHRIAVFDQRGPPAWYLGGSQKSISCKD